MGMSPRLLRPRASRFDPRSIANCTSWFDATNAGSLTFNGSNVSSWSNLVSGGTAYAQTTALQQPATTTLAGKTAINFAGGGNLAVRLDGPTLNALADTTNNVLIAFFVLQFTGTTNTTNRFFSNTQNWQAAGFGWFPRYSDGNSYWDAGQTSARVSGSITSTTINTGATIARLTRNGATASIHYNNTQIATRSNAANAIAGDMSLATRLAGGDASNSIALSEMIVYSRAISGTEIAAVQNYLARKYGVTLA